MLNRKGLILIIFLLSINNVNALLTADIINDTYIDSNLGANNFDGANYMRIRENFISPNYYNYHPYIELPYTSPIVYLHIYMYSYNNPVSAIYTVYNTTVFDVTSLTWFTRPTENNVAIGSIVIDNVEDWYNITLTNPSKYIYMKRESGGTGSQYSNIGTFETGAYPFGNGAYIEYSLPSINILTGKVTYLDTDNVIKNLPNATVYFNSTLNTTTDSNGNYSLSNIPFGNQIIYVSKNNAFNIVNATINLNISTTQNFQLTYSKPYLSIPIISGNYIQSTYSNNIKTMQLWSNPYYVWGIYNFTSANITKPCLNVVLTNTFQCDLVQNSNYSFHLQYSDIYNYDLNTYHPTLTGNRNFVTSSLYISNGQILNSGNIKSISLLPQGERENYLKGAFPDMLLVIIVIFSLCVIISFFHRGKHE
jgi:hypothetical protein